MQQGTPHKTKFLIADHATFIGLFGAFGIVALALLSGEGGVSLFFNVPALMIVIGGSTFIVLVKFSLKQFLGALKVAYKAFFFKLETPEDLISQALKLRKRAQIHGILSLETVEINNSFFHRGIQYLVDGISIDIIKRTLIKEMYQTNDRHENGRQIFTALADVCPAMGMIGTVIGLIKMLSYMDNPKSVGPAMAIALLTTLYGAMLGYMFAKPIADKLALRDKEERNAKLLIIDAIIGIEQGLNSYILEEMLMAYLPGAGRNQRTDPEHAIQLVNDQPPKGETNSVHE